MMQYDKKSMGPLDTQTDFVMDTFEKVGRLTDVLDAVYSDPQLSEYLAPKGGTAISLTFFNLSGLSLDIYFDFTQNIYHYEMSDINSENNRVWL